MTILIKRFLPTFFVLFSINVFAQNGLNNVCENAKWIEIETYGTKVNPEITDDFNFYKFIVPSSGQLRFVNTLYGENLGFSYFNLTIFSSCNGDEILEETYVDLQLDVLDLSPGDTLIMKIYFGDGAAEIGELIYNLNNTCEHAKWINLKSGGQSNLVEINHLKNTLEYQPDCYGANDLVNDSYYKMLVPPSGIIRFEHNYSYGINIFDTCNGNDLFCGFVENGIMESSSLNAGDTILLQVYQRNSITWQDGGYCYPWYYNCETIIKTEPLEFNLSIKEYIEPANSFCDTANWTDIENIAFTPLEYKLDISPVCNDGILYADAFYKFIVPSSGSIKLNRYITSIDVTEDVYYGGIWVPPYYEHYYGGFAVYENCNEDPLVCIKNVTTHGDNYSESMGNPIIIISDLKPMDTLILQLFTVIDISYTVQFEEAHPTLNNNCSKATNINLNQEIDCSLSAAFSLKNNNLNIQPTCVYNFFDEEPFADMFFQTTVPDNGSIHLNLSQSMGVAIYEDCHATSIFCDDHFNPNKLITGLPPNADIILQFFDYYNYYKDVKDFSFCLTDELPGNTACENANWINVTSEKTYLHTEEYEEFTYNIDCDGNVAIDYYNDVAIAYYKLIVPPSGRLEFNSESNVYKVKIFDGNCGNEAFFCSSARYTQINVDDLQPNDTIVAQITATFYSHLANISVKEVGTAPNNTCQNPTWINLKPDGKPTLVQVDHSSNTYDGTDNCYFNSSHLNVDSYYNIVVPPSGGIRIDFSNNYGISAFNSCNGKDIFCEYTFPNVTGGEIDVKNLNAGDTLLIQVFQLKLHFLDNIPLLFTINVQELKPLNYCHIDDWTALKAFYHSTNGDLWKNNAGWDQVLGASPPQNCNLNNLYGVSLDEEGRVKCIDLDGVDDCTYIVNSGGNNLTGTLPDEIGLLTELIELCLNYNEISGEINYHLRDLQFLKVLLLHGNKFTGFIPYDLFDDLKNLEILYLSANELSGSIPWSVGECESLIDLGLYQNQLTGGIPLAISNLKHLQVLNLRDNLLGDLIPATLSEISTLKGLYLNNNQFTGSFHDELAVLCNQLVDTNSAKHIDKGNSLDAKWDDFCDCGAGSTSTAPMYIDDYSPLKEVYQHNNDIIAVGDVVVGLTEHQSVTFSATNITLEEGFEVKKGSKFLAEYSPCSEE